MLTGHNPCLPPYEMYPIRQWNPNLSSGLEEIIIKCTQKNPDDRYQSCAELMYALEHYDELDHEYKKVQNRKWRTFLTTSVLTVVSLAACVGFKFAETSTTSKNYENYLKNAVSAVSMEEKIQDYENAIKLNPGEGEGYLNLLHACLDNTEEDGESWNFTQTEAAKMTEILGYKGDSNRSNESYLESDEAAYDEFAYQMGLAYYFYYNKDGNPQMSQKWFEIAAESSKLESYKIERAKVLAKIAGYDASLRSSGSNKSGDSTVTYRDYWQDMMQLISGKNLVEQDNSKMALVMYKNFIYQIYNYAVQFNAAGISETEINNELDKVETRLKTDIVVLNESDKGEIEGTRDELLEQIEKARQSVSMAYSTKDSNLTNKSGGKTDAGTGKND